ncbi:MAG TPA: DUF1116 domain-containing protein [Thermoanaerobaculia bacterium]
MTENEANRTAVERMIVARPWLVGVGRASEVVPGFEGRMLLHAGPPVEWERMSGPLRGALVGAALYEGWASDAEEAEALLASGAVRFDSCHHRGAAGPMAGVVAPSFAVYVVDERTHGGRFFSTLNEGSGKVLRFGAYAPEVLDRLRWLNETLAPLVDEALRATDGLDLHATLAQMLHRGDEGHCSSLAGSLMLLRHVAPAIARSAAPAARRGRALEVLGGNWLAILNPIMAACKAICDAGHGVAGSTVVTRLSRNGTDFGIRVSGAGERWFTGPSQVPVGPLDEGYGQEDANPDIGDSVITECAGIGAFAMAAAPAIARLVGGTPESAVRSTLEMYRITVAEHPDFTIPGLGFRGTPIGIDARRVVELELLPHVNTGIAHRQPGIGQIGFGLVRPPLAPFRAALAAIDA